MNEAKVRELVEALFVHVAAFPWSDTGFTRSRVTQAAAKDQVVSHTINEILKLGEQGEKTTNSKTVG